MSVAEREDFHRAIDEMSSDDLKELSVFLTYLGHKKTQPGSAWLRTIYDIFAPVREEGLRSGMTEEEIDQIIDEAIEDSRRERDT